MMLFFWICFGVGAAYTLVAFLLGEVINVFDFDFDLNGTVSPLKPAVIAAFITVFGGSGLLLVSVAPWYAAVPAAALFGAAVAYLMYRFIIVPLSKAQNTSAVEIQSLIGHTAKVTERIFQGGYGQITYHVNGSTFTAPAKAENGGEIQRGKDVEIMYIQDSTYFVQENAAALHTANG